MNCAEWEEQVALYVGGDLEETASVERHLAVCDDCWDFSKELESNRDLLADVPLDVTALASVRAGVLRQVQGRRFAWGKVAAAILLAGIGFQALSSRMHVDSLPYRPLQVAGVPNLPVPRTAVHHATHRKPIVEKHQPVVIKLITSDPNIVIYWIAD